MNRLKNFFIKMIKTIFESPLYRDFDELFKSDEEKLIEQRSKKIKQILKIKLWNQ